MWKEVTVKKFINNELCALNFIFPCCIMVIVPTETRIFYILLELFSKKL